MRALDRQIAQLTRRANQGHIRIIARIIQPVLETAAAIF